MKHLVYFIAAFVAAVTTASDVIEFDDSNFNDDIGKHAMILVEFFAPWCGHCKKLAPEYEVAATKLKNNDPPIPLAKIDCTKNSDTCGKFGVSGYPTLKIFREGEFSQEYSGPRSADGIMSTLKKLAGPASKNLETVEAWKKFLENHDAVVVAYYEAGNDDLAVFDKTANAMRDDYKFGHTSAAEVLEAAGSKNVVKLHRPKRLASIFEESEVALDKKPTKPNMESFLGSNVNGLCGHITTDNAAKFKRPLAIAFDEKLDYVKNPKGSNYWRNRVMKFGKEFADSITFAVANKQEMTMLLPESGLPEVDSSAKNPPPVVVIIDSNDRKYIMTTPFGKETFQAFLQEYKDGKIDAHIKSETVPEPNDGPVKVVVGKNFDEIVMDESKDVLVEFYAPWCGHCKALEPKWTELGEAMKDNDEIVIAKVDATANDSPKQFAVSGFPTIYWAPKDNKKNPEKYQGGREVADFVKFLKKKASSKVKTEL